MLANPTPKEDSWAFLPIGSPLPDNLVSVFGHENAFVALWYKNGSPVHGYAWSESDGTLQASFPYGTAELTGKVDVDGMIQVLQYNGDHNSLGFWYRWVKYGDRHEQQQQLDSQPLRCGHSMPILWPNRAGGPLLGSLDLKTEQARFSQAGKVEMVDGKPLEQMLILVRCHKGGPPDCECPKCQRGPPAAKHVRWDSVVQEAVISEVDLTSNNSTFGAGNLDSTFGSAVDLDAIFTNAEQKPDNNNADKAGDMDADTALQQSESDCTASGCSSRSASSVSVDVIPNVVDSPPPDNSKNKDNKFNGCGVNSSEDSSPDRKKDIEQTKKAAEEAIKAHNNGFYIGLMTKEEAELMWTPRFRLYHRVESNPLRDIDLPLCLVFRCPSGKHFRHFRIRCRHGRQGVDVEGEPQFKALSELITFYDNFDRNLKQLKRNNKRK